MSETKHTPLPWVIVKKDIRFFADDHGTMPCTISQTISQGESCGEPICLISETKNKVANAAFIVLACNNFDRLVRACTALQSAAHAVTNVAHEQCIGLAIEVPIMSGLLSDLWTRANESRAAIAKATE